MHFLDNLTQVVDLFFGQIYTLGGKGKLSRGCAMIEFSEKWDPDKILPIFAPQF